MSARLPYEEVIQEKLADIPLPDENLAWEDMRKRLEDEDDDKVIAWWRRGCMLWGLLLLVLVPLAIWIGWGLISNRSQLTDGSENDETKTEKVTTLTNTHDELKRDTLKTGNRDPVEISRSNKYNQEQNHETNIKTSNSKPGAKIVYGKAVDLNASKTKAETVTINQETSLSNKDDQTIRMNNKQGAALVIDTVGSKQIDSVNKIPTIKQKDESNNKAKEDSSKKRPLFFSAGIAMQQMLPIAGQKSVPYNSLGRKGTLADYIPSVYLRLNRKDKWFVQGEFKYGAPQYTKELVYREQNKLDTFGTNAFLTKTSNTLKKTYYHQLPVTFNYFVKPGWSIGAGISWNKFVSAISDLEVRGVDLQTMTDSLVSKGIVSTTSDTAFAKSYLQGVMESQYKWKRFSFGMRYAFGLQPYLTFTLPGGQTQKEKASSFQVFLRFELWRQREKP